MSKPKTDAKRKGGKRAKDAVPAKPERCKWDESYCAKVEALGAEGKRAPEIRKVLGISPSTWRNWVKSHACFAEAVEQAADLAEAWWIDVGRKGMMLGTGFSSQTFIYLTKNIFPARFRDRQDHQITGANDGPTARSPAGATQRGFFTSANGHHLRLAAPRATVPTTPGGRRLREHDNARRGSEYQHCSENERLHR